MTTPSPAAVRPAPYRLLDAWRGVASLGVVAFHWSEVAYLTAPELKENFFYQACGFGFLGVQVFFVVSGFCIAAAACAALNRQGVENTKKIVNKYLFARARRIFPTYWAGLVLVLLFSAFATALAHAGRIEQNIYTNFNVRELFSSTMAANLTLLGVPLHQPMHLAVAWTLCYEGAFYLVTGVALGMAAKFAANGSSGVFMLNLLHSVTIACAAALLVFPSSVPFPLELWPEFGLGVFVYDLLSTVPGNTPLRQKGVKIAFAGTLVLLAAFVIFRNVDVGFINPSSRLTFTTSAGFALLLLGMHRFDARFWAQKGVRGLGFIGLFSYSLYLTHTIFLRIAGQILQRLHIFPRFHAAAFAIVIGFCLITAYGFFLLFEKPILSRRKIREEPVP